MLRLSSASAARFVEPITHSWRPGMLWSWRRNTSATTRCSAANSHLGKLYKTAKGTFKAGRVLSEGDIASVRALVAAVPASELGIPDTAKEEEGRSWWGALGLGKARQQPHHASRLPTIRYSEVFESKDFCICVFFLPKGCILPYHDHPQMTVFSRVLYGQLQVKAYDWIGERTFIEYGEEQPARLSVEQAVTKKDQPVVLFPRHGNIHSFQADSACAVLDVIAPPYDQKIPERSCSYYTELFNANSTISLKKIEDPRTFLLESSPYKGIRVGA